MAFKVATKEKSRALIALTGPSGSGKTFTALVLASAMAGSKGRVAVIDSERGSASKYADQFRFIVDELESHHPEVYMAAIKAASEMGVDVLIIDSLSHAWMGKDGALEQVDKAKARSQSGNSFTAWGEVTPLQNRLVDAILAAPMHIIVTMRSKTEYVLETNDKGKQVPRKVGLAPVQRDGLEYEFDVVGDMDLKNRMVVSKTRCSALAGQVIDKPGAELAKTLIDWLNGPTAEDAVTYVQAEADTCFSVEDLSALKKLLAAKGGAYYNDTVKDILRTKFEQLKPAPTETTTQPAAAAPAAPLELAAKPDPDVAGVPLLDPAAAGTLAPPTLEQAMTHVDRLLIGVTDYDGIRKVKEDCIGIGGVYNDPKVVTMINLKYFELFPEESPANRAMAQKAA